VARIVLKELFKTFGGYTAVNGVNFEVRDGEFLIMVGPSGCGKTTTLNMISGLETPTSGDIVIGNTVVNDLEPGERGLGMVFQDLALFPHMTVFENIAFGLRVKRVPDGEVTKRVTAAAEAVHIKPLLAKLPRQCSGGESQRVALARTIVTNPSVFLMDEPLSSLDAKLRVDMRTELKALHHRLKATFVYVTHDQAEAMTMADRIVVMSKGRIEQSGTPLEIYGRPSTLFVAGFFGTPTMNFLEGTIAANGSGRVFRSSGLEHTLGEGVPADLAGREVVLGVRSEHVIVEKEGERTGTVQLTEPLGDATLVHFGYGQPKSLVAKVPPTSPLEPGNPLSFRFVPGHCHLFDPASGARLHAFYVGARTIWGQGAFGAKHFIWVWFLSSLVNGAAGYFRVGIPLLNEIAAFIPIFGIPAAAAWFLSRRSD
jgi:ABC-type sugar transport system ATPase subunit